MSVTARQAFVVGVKNYAFTPLRNTLNDAKDVAAKLKGMGFRVELSLDPTLKEFYKAQDQFEERLGPGVLALFYFSGHGCEYEGDNYMLMKETPDGVDEDKLDRTSIPLDKLLEGIRQKGAAFIVVILDACRSVRVTRGTRDASSSGLGKYEPKPPLKDGGTVIAYATAPRKVAYDGEPGGRNGFYTHYLLKFLAMKLPVEKMLKKVGYEIQEKTERKQEPWVSSNFTSERAEGIQLAGLKPRPQQVPPPPRPNPVRPQVTQETPVQQHTLMQVEHGSSTDTQSGGLLIQPDDELKFRLELKKQIPATIRLTNNGAEEIAFKVKTTAPKKYCVKPNTGFVGKGQTVNVHVIMQAQREWPQDMMKCKDKFLVQSCPSGGITEFTELFVKGKEDIKEQKLKVSYSQPAPPPSPVPEGEEGQSEDAAKPKSMFTAAETAPVSNDVGSLQRELERSRTKNVELSKDLDMALQGGKQQRVTGFSLFHLLLVAIVAFLVGHYS